jgi:hypothetical protein
VQDDVPRPVPGHLRSAGAADLLDQSYEFERAFHHPPRSWADFVHGSSHLSRAAAAETLRIADAVAAHKQKPGDWEQWKRDHQTLAGG